MIFVLKKTELGTTYSYEVSSFQEEENAILSVTGQNLHVVELDEFQKALSLPNVSGVACIIRGKVCRLGLL